MFTNFRALKQVGKADVNAFIQVCKIANLISKYEITNPKNHPRYRCHTVCRAIAEHIPCLTVVDGYYFGLLCIRRKSGKVLFKPSSYPLSWLKGPAKTIIDPYPVGCLSPPILVPIKGKLVPFGAGLYFPDSKITANVTKPVIIKETRILVEHIRKLLGKNKR